MDSTLYHTQLLRKQTNRCAALVNFCDINILTMASTITADFNNRLTEISENSTLVHRSWWEIKSGEKENFLNRICIN